MRKLSLAVCFSLAAFFMAGGALNAENARVPTQNEFLVEALRLSNLARLAFIDGDYESSIAYSAESVRYSELSDEYIAHLALIMSAINEAEDLLRWAETSGALPYYPKEIEQAKRDLRSAYTEKRAYNWDEALDFALLAKEDLRDVAAPPPKEASTANMPKKPAQYKVRPWDLYGDCLWNIAKWFYNDPWKWRSIYALNKTRLPDPNNPNWIEVGTVIDLPPLNGEARTGYWDTGLLYDGD